VLKLINSTDWQFGLISRNKQKIEIIDYSIKKEFQKENKELFSPKSFQAVTVNYHQSVEIDEGIFFKKSLIRTRIF